MLENFSRFYLMNFGVVDIILDAVLMFGIFMIMTVFIKRGLYPIFVNMLSMIVLFWALVFWHNFGLRAILLEMNEIILIRFVVNLGLSILIGFIIVKLFQAVFDSVLAATTQVNVYSLYESPTQTNFVRVFLATIIALIFSLHLIFAITLITPVDIFLLTGAENALIIKLQTYVADVTTILVTDPGLIVKYFNALFL